jgi:hypothetical protein
MGLGFRHRSEDRNCEEDLVEGTLKILPSNVLLAWFAILDLGDRSKQRVQTSKVVYVEW